MMNSKGMEKETVVILISLLILLVVIVAAVILLFPDAKSALRGALDYLGV